MAHSGDPRLRAAGVLANRYAYTIETGTGVLVGACMNGPIAFAMYRAAQQEYLDRLMLKKGETTLAEAL